MIEISSNDQLAEKWLLRMFMPTTSYCGTGFTITLSHGSTICLLISFLEMESF